MGSALEVMSPCFSAANSLTNPSPRYESSVITSGGDAQGMNASVRSVVRLSLQLGAKVFAICEGYKGLIDNEIVEMHWSDVSSIIQQVSCASFWSL